MQAEEVPEEKWDVVTYSWHFVHELFFHFDGAFYVCCELRCLELTFICTWRNWYNQSYKL